MLLANARSRRCGLLRFLPIIALRQRQEYDSKAIFTVPEVPMVTSTLSLAILLTPMQFKAALLAACGLKNSEIAAFLNTTEPVIKIVLTDVVKRTGCSDSDKLIARYVWEIESGLLELARLHRELAELEARTGQNLRRRSGALIQRIN
jgi:DNA-binding NarL/FixJ family response regulator